MVKYIDTLQVGSVVRIKLNANPQHLAGELGVIVLITEVPSGRKLYGLAGERFNGWTFLRKDLIYLSPKQEQEIQIIMNKLRLEIFGTEE